MADPKAEPSIEEILASIRDIIADDSAPAKPAATAPRPAAPEPADAFDVLELDTPVAPAEPEPKSESDPLPDLTPASGNDLDFTDEIAAILEEPVVVKNVEPEPMMAVVDTGFDKGLLDDRARDAVTAQIARLTANVAVSRSVASAGLTLEDLVRDMLTPLLKEWLDANLPSVIEKMVAREIARLVDRV